MDFTQWKGARAYVLYCLAATALLGVVFLSYFSATRRDIEKQAEIRLIEATRQYAAATRTKMEGELDTVRSLASIFGQLGLTGCEEVLPLLDEHVKRNKFKRMAVVTSDGMAFTSDDLVFQARNRAYYRKALRGESSLEVLTVDRTDDDVVMIYTAPIRVGGKTQAALSATRRLAAFLSAIDDRPLGGVGQMAVTDGVGRVLFWEGALPDRFANIMALMPPSEGGGPGDIQNGGTFRWRGEPYLMAHERLRGLADWHVFAIAPASALLKNVGRMERGVACLLLFLLAVILTALWLIARRQYRTTRRLEQAKTALETVVENIPGGFFRYDNDGRRRIDYVSEGFLRLLGHTRKSFAAACGDRFDLMVHPDDRKRVLASLEEQLAHGDHHSVEYRASTADGRELWLYDRGRLVREPSGRSRFYVIVMDITPLRQIRQALTVSEERYRILTELSDRIIFEHDIEKRDGFLSPRFREKFGYDPELDPSTGALSESCIHEEDRTIYRDLVSRLLSGNSSSEEVRVLRQPAGFLWCRIQALAVRDDAGGPARVVGEITDIDREKRNTERLSIRAQRDPLTGLYNASAIRGLIESCLSSSSARDRHALLVLDVNRFKEINDTRGHLAGDRALIEASRRLLAALRDTDLAGRIGGDEFVVLLRGLSADETPQRSVERLRNALSFPIDDGLSVSVSLGSAVFPDDAEDYLELFRLADAAMYADKKRFKARQAAPSEESPKDGPFGESRR